jgi:hypothetical protein
MRIVGRKRGKEREKEEGECPLRKNCPKKERDGPIL